MTLGLLEAQRQTLEVRSHLGRGTRGGQLEGRVWPRQLPTSRTCNAAILQAGKTLPLRAKVQEWPHLYPLPEEITA